jgi:hypothetical protein
LLLPFVLQRVQDVAVGYLFLLLVAEGQMVWRWCMLSLWLVVGVPGIWWGIDVVCLAPLEVVQVPQVTLGTCAGSGSYGASVMKMSMSCFRVSICVGWSGFMGALGLGVSRAARMLVRHVAMMSVDDAPGIGIFSGSHTSVLVMRSALVEGM